MTRVSFIGTCLVALAACHEVKPPGPPAPKKVPPPVASSAAPAPSAPPLPKSPAPAPVDPATSSRSWSVQSTPFLRGLALAEGHVVVQSRDKLTTLALRGGKTVASVAACEAPHKSLAVVDGQAWLMCTDSLQAFSLPDLKKGARHPLPSPGKRVAFGPARALVASSDGIVRAIGLKDGAVSRSWAVGEAPAALSAGPEGRFAAGRTSGDVVVYAADGSAQRLGEPAGFEVMTLAWATDHQHLLAGAGPSVAVWRLGAKPEAVRFSAVREVTDARWIDARRVITVGADGVLVLDVETRAVAALPGDPGGEELVALASGSGRSLCAGDRNGRVTCWGASRPRGVAPTDTAPGVRCTGTLSAVEGRDLQVVAEPGAPLPEVGDEVKLRRFARTTAKKRQTDVWLEVARARVVAVEGARISLKLVGPIGFVPVEGDALAKGVAVELRWNP